MVGGLCLPERSRRQGSGFRVGRGESAKIPGDNGI